jgi:hypothetical protein
MVVNSRRIRWVGMEHAQELANRGEFIILRYIKEIGCEHVDWIQLAQDRASWRALLNRVIKLRVP